MVAAPPRAWTPSSVFALDPDAFSINRLVADRFSHTADALEAEGANPHRVRAYRRAAITLRDLPEPVEDVFRREGLTGLDRLPGIGRGLAAAIREYILTGRMPFQERFGLAAPGAVLRTVPGIGCEYARRLHDQLGIATLEDLEAAAYDGRLAALPGFGPKRIGAVRQTLAARLGRGAPVARVGPEPPVAELLDVDREYRELADARRLPTIAPRRMNPSGRSWLPVLSTHRGARHYTALFSNTPRAHELGKTRDWVVLYSDQDGHRNQYTVVTETSGPRRGQRVVRGRGDVIGAGVRITAATASPPA
jgi:DNA polymerase (family 10)